VVTTGDGSGDGAPGRPAVTDALDPSGIGPGRILRIAIQTLGVLVAEPVYLLFDMAVVGRLGPRRWRGSWSAG
jgi:hypothetical protein